MEREPPRPTLEQLRRGTPRCWVVCKHCLHPTPIVFVDLTPRATCFDDRRAAPSAGARGLSCSTRAGGHAYRVRAVSCPSPRSMTLNDGRPVVFPDIAFNSDECGDCAEPRRTTSVNGPLPMNGAGAVDGPFLRPARYPRSAHRWMCMAKWSAEASCWEAAEGTILVTLPTLPTSEAGRTPEGGEHARRPSYGM